MSLYSLGIPASAATCGMHIVCDTFCLSRACVLVFLSKFVYEYINYTKL